jgi:hypothetical protein
MSNYIPRVKDTAGGVLRKAPIYSNTDKSALFQPFFYIANPVAAEPLTPA